MNNKMLPVTLLIVVIATMLMACVGSSKEPVQTQIPQSELEGLRAQLAMAQTVYETAAQVTQDKLDAKSTELNAKITELAAQSSQLTVEQQKNANLQSTNATLNTELQAIKDTQLTNTYSFTYRNRLNNWYVAIPIGTYYYYTIQSRAEDNAKYSKIVSDKYGDSVLKIITDEINKIAVAYDYNKLDIINIVRIFTQTLPRTNKDSTAPYDNYTRYPIETLLGNGGDCEDNSILAAAILTRLNCEVVFFVYDQYKHVALGVYYPAFSGLGGWEYQGKKYYYFESTGAEGYDFGIIPPKISAIQPVVVTINP